MFEVKVKKRRSVVLEERDERKEDEDEEDDENDADAKICTKRRVRRTSCGKRP